MGKKKVFVFCGDDCKSEGMTKQQILTAIEQAISTGKITDVDTGFVTTIKEKNHLVGLSFWVGTQAEYNALPEKANNCFYIITDDTSFADVVAVVEQHTNAIENLSVDYIVERGSSGGFTYEKWNSGKAVCFGYIPYNFINGSQTNINNHYVVNTEIDLPSNVFNSPPRIGFVTNDLVSCVTSYNPHTSTQTKATIRISTVVEYGDNNRMELMCYFIGKWK